MATSSQFDIVMAFATPHTSGELPAVARRTPGLPL